MCLLWPHHRGAMSQEHLLHEESVTWKIMTSSVKAKFGNGLLTNNCCGSSCKKFNSGFQFQFQGFQFQFHLQFHQFQFQFQFRNWNWAAIPIPELNWPNPVDDAMIFQAPSFCIHNVHDKLYCSMNNYRWKCRHFRNVLCHSIKVNWSRWIMNVNRRDIALIILVALVHTGPTVVTKLSSMWLEIYIITFFIISCLNKYKSMISANQLSTRHM